jgi:restriction system protein
MRKYPPLSLTPKEYELEVKKSLDGLSLGLTDYYSEHRALVSGVDGEYEIDITVRFTALGVDYLTLVECKRYNKPVEREKVQALLSKMHSVGAQKGIIFSTSGFQSGATDFAAVHGIALVELLDGSASYFRKSADDDGPIPWSQIPPGVPRIVGWLHKGATRMIVEPDRPEYLRGYLEENDSN